MSILPCSGGLVIAEAPAGYHYYWYHYNIIIIIIIIIIGKHEFYEDRRLEEGNFS